MCGIVGYIGKNDAVPYLLEGLHKLEYRGYDSAGIALMKSNRISITKTAGRIDRLEEKIKGTDLSGATVGIGHTRWATHGEPNDENSHPHTSQTGLFTVVHNGIIENYEMFKHKLQQEGFIFNSDTDTEVIAHLLEQNYCGDILSAANRTCCQLEGSYAVAAVCSKVPDTIICMRHSSPLVIGESNMGTFIASDVTAMLKYTKDVYTLGDDEIAIIRKDGIKFYDINCCETEKKKEHITWSDTDAEKCGYEHFMMKEIMEQSNAVSETVNPRITNGKITLDNMALTKEDIKKINSVYFVACGSAYHVGVSGTYIIERLAKIPCRVQTASEFRYCEPVIDSSTLVIIISQSGETADTLAALRLSKQKGAKVLSIVNVVGSTIAKESDSVLYTYAGPEIAVATTKAYSAQLSLVYILSAYICEARGLMDEKRLEDYTKGLQSLAGEIELCLEKRDEIKELASIFEKSSHVFFIGRNIDYACALEAALKMKEISYIHCEAYPAGELKHGTISLIEEGSIVVAVCCYDDVFAKTVSNIKEVKARGAYVVALTTEKHKDGLSDANVVITIPNTKADFLPSTQIIPMQLLSYFTAKGKHCDIDKPRNLAKSVTVE